MAGTALLKFKEHDTELGQRAADALAADPDLDAKALFWSYDANLEEWKFVVATPIYDKTENGPQKAYLQVRKILDDNDLLDELPLDSTRVLGSNDPIITAMRKFVGEFSGTVTLSGVRVNEVHLDDVLLYRLHKK